MKTMTQDFSLSSEQHSGFINQIQYKVIWLNFVNKQRMTKPFTQVVILANRPCFLLRRKK